MNLTRFHKTPDERLDYEVSFARWLEEGDSITQATAEIEDGTALIYEVEYVGQLARVWIEEGAVGELNKVTVTIETADGRTKQSAFELKIRGL